MLGDLVEIAVTVSPFVAGWAGIKYMDKRHAIAAEPTVVDGRTHQEWEDIIRNIGKDATEELMLGPLQSTVKDGEIILDRDTQHAWRPQALMGDIRWRKIEREWWPERFCKWCGEIKFNGFDGCDDDCYDARQFKRMEADRKRSELERELVTKREQEFYNNYAKIKRKQSPTVTTVRNLANNTSGYRVIYKEKQHWLSLDEVTKFQSAHGLAPTGRIDQATAEEISWCLGHGVPLKDSKIDGVQYSFRRKGKDVIVTTAKRGEYATSTECLGESFGDLWQLVRKALVKKLDDADARAKPTITTSINDLDRAIKAAQEDMKRSRAEMERNFRRMKDDWNDPYSKRRRGSYDYYNDELDFGYKW